MAVDDRGARLSIASDGLAHLPPQGSVDALQRAAVTPRAERLSQQRVQLAVQNSPQQRRALFYETVLSGLDFAKELRVFTLADYFLSKWQRTIRSVHTAERTQQMEELRWQSGLVILAAPINGTATVFVIILAFNGRLTLGTVALYLSAVANVQTSLFDLTSVLTSLHHSLLFYRHYEILLSQPQALSTAHPTAPIPSLRSGIEFRNVSFRYSDDQQWILRDVSLTIPVGQCVALVGLNGAGKTTLVKLLARL